MPNTPDFFVSAPEIVTARLRLRALTADDAPAVFEYASREQVTKYVLFPTHQSIADSEAFISRALNESPTEFGIVWAIELKDPGKLIGTIGLHHLDLESKKVEVGYTLHDDHWNKGYTTEALAALISHTFEQTSINRIEAHHVAEHKASGRVMQKAGMSFEGTLREVKMTKGVLNDMTIYAILRRDYESS